jgi:hypothetical protein
MDVALQHRDMWMVGRVQNEALREGLTQASIDGLRVLDHRCVRLQRDVDGRGGDLLLAGRLCIAELRSQDTEQISAKRIASNRTELNPAHGADDGHA